MSYFSSEALPMEGHQTLDPFALSPHDARHQRYSAFDASQSSVYLNGSPTQAKKALQAHLSETNRRLQEASVLGKSLVQQKQELEDRLKEVDEQQTNNEIGPELRRKLADLEKEFNEVGRETARAFLPKSRVPSGESDATGGGSVYSSEAQHSPTKVSVPSRKQRNQQPSRINDIALATEISSSLLTQLKELQAVLLEKDEALKAVNLDKSLLELENEGLNQRVRSVEDSEQRLKDENWGLETQVRELEAEKKASADAERRITHSLNLARSEKSKLERELEESKQLYIKLNDDHVSKTKHHEAELSGLRRDVVVAETERATLQRKVDEVIVQNQELAKAAAYRMRADELARRDDTSPDDAGEEGDAMTPEESPPPSPTKATPRHGQLESETLKHSLHHAHRMIQQLKNNIHREKTEKLELKRMLQDARDDLDTVRNEAKGLSSATKRKKNDKDVFKKPPRPDRLGAFRTGTEEIVEEEDDWEEHDDLQLTPSRRSRNTATVPGAFPSGFSSAAETGTETSDAFETANERDGTATETDAFQTGAETLDGDSTDDLTETEVGQSMGTIRARRPSSLAIVGNRNSYQSTASTSGDEADDVDVKTPQQHQHPRYKLKMRNRQSTSRGSIDIFSSPPPTSIDSPPSVSNSNNSTPAQGKSLFAELGAFSGGESEDGSSVAEGTPSRSSLLSPESSPKAFRRPTVGKSPLQAAFVPKTVTVMVDSETMTEPWPPAQLPKLEISSISSNATEPSALAPPALHISSLHTHSTEPISPAQVPLQLSSYAMQNTEPRSPPQVPLHLSSYTMQGTEPMSPPQVPLRLSSYVTQTTEPIAARSPPLDLSAFTTQDTGPRAAPLPALHLSSVSVQDTVPRAAPVPTLDISSVSAQDVAPVSQAVTPASLDFSSVSQQATEPKELAEANVHRSAPSAPVLMLPVSIQATEPLEPAPVLHTTSLTNQTSEPKDQVPLVPLGYSSVSGLSTQPVEQPKPKPQFSAIVSQATESIEPRRPAAPQFSTLSSQTTDPVEAPTQLPQFSKLSYQATPPVEPPRPARLRISVRSSQSTEPVEPTLRLPKSQLSSIIAQNTAPIAWSRPENNISSVMVLQDTQPESPTLPAFLPSPSPSRPSTANRAPPLSLSLSSIHSQETEPQVPSRPVTAHREVPVAPFASYTSAATDANGNHVSEGARLDMSEIQSRSTDATEKSIPGGSAASFAAQVDQSSMLSKAAPTSTVDEGTQTMVSADQIDKLLAARNAQRHSNAIAAASIERRMSPPSSPRRASSDPKTPRRLSSSSSIRSRVASPPPLPANHKDVIAAAALKAPSISGPPGEMGPPAIPASAYKQRPQTPTIRPPSLITSPTKNGGTTPRARTQTSRTNLGRSGASSPITRHSSVSSFASDVERRLNPGANPFAQAGFDMNTTDPRMIQAITQTMIGEFLWKYTRKTGREGLSATRHRRFFWVHPYTRTLYWSDQDPATAGRHQLKAKSVAIQAVQVVTDDNPYPPGLHRKSLVIVTPGRSIKFTATTGQRHDTWYNALSYLLLRTGDGEQEDAAEIQDEFNPAFRTSSRQTERSRASSFFSHRTSSPFSHRAASPAHNQVPTLRRPGTPSKSRMLSAEEPASGRLSSLSGMFRPPSALRNSFSSSRKRTSQVDVSAPDSPSPKNGSRFDLAQELALKSVRESGEHIAGMENVRACCDGKHDVGALHGHSHTAKARHSYATLSVRSHSRASTRKD